MPAVHRAEPGAGAHGELAGGLPMVQFRVSRTRRVAPVARAPSGLSRIGGDSRGETSCLPHDMWRRTHRCRAGAAATCIDGTNPDRDRRLITDVIAMCTRCSCGVHAVWLRCDCDVTAMVIVNAR